MSVTCDGFHGIDTVPGNSHGVADNFKYLRGDDKSVYQFADGEVLRSTVNVFRAAEQVVLIYRAVGDIDVVKQNSILLDMVARPVPQISIRCQKIDGSDKVVIVRSHPSDSLCKIPMMGKCCVLHVIMLTFLCCVIGLENKKAGRFFICETTG